MSPSVALQWRSGRVFLVGDAAARVSPAGGLGMNNGVQSAHNLAWKLAEVLRGRAGEELLDTYEAERLAAARFTFENSGGNAEEVMGIVMAAMGGEWDRAKEMIARSRRSGSGYGQDFGIVYSGAAVEPDGSVEKKPADLVNEYIPQGRPGHRAPHVWIERGGKKISTLDLFGRGFVALCGPDADAAKAAAWREGVEVLVEGRGFADAGGAWRELYGVGPRGAVLVRPDGYVAARRG
jgi:putative polyketide hydroxylase